MWVMVDDCLCHSSSKHEALLISKLKTFLLSLASWANHLKYEAQKKPY
jgi:hypothetical protein